MKNDYQKEKSLAEDAAKTIRMGNAVIPYGYIKSEKSKGWFLPGGKHTFNGSEARQAAVNINKRISAPTKNKTVTVRIAK